MSETGKFDYKAAAKEPGWFNKADRYLRGKSREDAGEHTLAKVPKWNVAKAEALRTLLDSPSSPLREALVTIWKLECNGPFTKLPAGELMNGMALNQAYSQGVQRVLSRLRQLATVETEGRVSTEGGEGDIFGSGLAGSGELEEWGYIKPDKK